MSSFYVGQKFYSPSERNRAVTEINKINSTNCTKARQYLENEVYKKYGYRGYCFYDGAEYNNENSVFIKELVSLGFKMINLGSINYSTIEMRGDYTTQIVSGPSSITTTFSTGYDGYSINSDAKTKIEFEKDEEYHDFIEVVNTNLIKRTQGIMYYPPLKKGCSYDSVFNKVSALWAVKLKQNKIKTTKSKTIHSKNEFSISEVIFRFMQFPVCLAYIAVFVLGIIQGLDDISLFYKIAPVSIAVLYTICYIFGTAKMLTDKERYIKTDTLERLQTVVIMPIIMVLPYPLIFNWLNQGFLAFLGIILLVLWIGGFIFVLVNDFLGHLKFNFFTQFFSMKNEKSKIKKDIENAEKSFNLAGGEKNISNLRKEIKNMIV